MFKIDVCGYMNETISICTGYGDGAGEQTHVHVLATNLVTNLVTNGELILVPS